MRTKPIYVEIDIAAHIDTVWELTQNPAKHTRWDARFSSITPLEELDGGGYRFRYARRMPLHTITGTGTSIGERIRPDGSRTSALRFTTTDPLSPLGEGRGYWRYLPIDGGTRFITGFDYHPGWGQTVDAWIVRPLVGRMTAWSFDRLRMWAESGNEPRGWSALWRRDRPRSSRCRRQPRHGGAMDDAPLTLANLESP